MEAALFRASLPMNNQDETRRKQMKRSAHSILILGLFLTFALLAGCKKRKHDHHHGNDHKDHKHNHKGHKHDHKGHDHKKVRSWLVPAYEKIRKALAADSLELCKTSAKKLAAKANEVKGHDKKAFASISAAAKKLSMAKDIKNARLSFGELSKALITHLHAHKEMKGLQAYQCPMAKGYKKWLQADAKMANPYMGKKMLKCGGKTAFKP
jgi:hypothetical protein